MCRTFKYCLDAYTELAQFTHSTCIRRFTAWWRTRSDYGLIAEEIAPEHLGKTMGLYIAGTAFGGMMGRVGMGILVEYFSWRTALGLLGAICFICSIAFLKLLPASRNFVQKKG